MALERAVQRFHIDVVVLLLKYAQTDARMDARVTFLRLITSADDVKSIRVNVAMWAASQRSRKALCLDMFKAVLDFVDINEKDHLGNTVLQLIVDTGQVNFLNAMYPRRNDIDFTVRDVNGSTALHRLIFSLSLQDNYAHRLFLRLAEGNSSFHASLMQKSAKSRTVPMLAIQWRRFGLATMLLKYVDTVPMLAESIINTQDTKGFIALTLSLCSSSFFQFRFHCDFDEPEAFSRFEPAEPRWFSNAMCVSHGRVLIQTSPHQGVCLC